MYIQDANEFKIYSKKTYISATTDNFRLHYIPWMGNGELVARVASFHSDDPDGKTGIMFRKNTAADASYSYLYLTSSGDVCFSSRSSTGDTSVTKAGTLKGVIRCLPNQSLTNLSTNQRNY